jgi:4-amino-4-deoxy-L-arabinose transferase-like glycosyltransferase
LIALLVLGFLAGLVLIRRANIAWDDADYLRRGLANARQAGLSGSLWVLPRAVGLLHLEQPKPPWLVGWIELGALVLGSRHLDLLILHSTIVPYGILLFAVITIGRSLGGLAAGLLALVCLVSSPSSLTFGGKVMVETYLSLWLLCTFALASLLIVRPSRTCGIALGLVIGLALLTKLTVALFLPIPMLYWLASALRRRSERRALLRPLLWCGLICIAVAGPWYARNAVSAVKFAIFSSRYNELAEGRSDRVPAARRMAMMAGDLPGWPMTVTVTAAALAGLLAGSKGSGSYSGADSLRAAARLHFTRMAWLGAGTGAVVLLGPSYFDSRFLLPIWPALAVDLGTRLTSTLTRLDCAPRFLVGFGLAASVLAAPVVVAREPFNPTFWSTTRLIDDLVSRYGIANLVNVGNCASWNVCKTGLMNELRATPGDCFVLHDLTKLGTDRAQKLLSRADAVVVLERPDVVESLMQYRPGMNRGYGAMVEQLNVDPRFTPVALAAVGALPQLRVYVRTARLEAIGESLKSKGVERR